MVTLVHGVTEEGEARALSPDDVNFAYRRTDLAGAFRDLAGRFRSLLMAITTQLPRRVMEAARQACLAAAARCAQCGIDLQKSARKLRGDACSRRAGIKGHPASAARPSRISTRILSWNLGGARAADVHALIETARAKGDREQPAALAWNRR